MQSRVYTVRIPELLSVCVKYADRQTDRQTDRANALPPDNTRGKSATPNNNNNNTTIRTGSTRGKLSLRMRKQQNWLSRVWNYLCLLAVRTYVRTYVWLLLLLHLFQYEEKSERKGSLTPSLCRPSNVYGSLNNRVAFSSSKVGHSSQCSTWWVIETLNNGI